MSDNFDNGPSHTGTLKWFNRDKGYGFIVDDSDNKDVFVHYNDLCFDQNRITDGMKLEFQVIKEKKGFKAEQVKEKE